MWTGIDRKVLLLEFQDL